MPRRAGLAGVAELVDALDLGSSAARRGGSSPFARTRPGSLLFAMDWKMQVTVTSTDGLKRELQVAVPAKDLEARVSAKLDELKNTIRLKGFRPGKVPVAHLKKAYGKQVMSEVIQYTVGTSSQKALEEQALRPALKPAIDLEGEIAEVLTGRADLTYKMTF